MAREPILLQIPNNLEPWEANNWRKLANAINAMVVVENKVNSTTTGLSTSAGKIKIDEKDKVSDYLEEKLIAGTGITLTESLTGGVGSKILTAAVSLAHNGLSDMADTTGVNEDHDERYRVVQQAAEPTTTADFWYDTDAPNDYSFYDNIMTYGGEVLVFGGNILYKR